MKFFTKEYITFVIAILGFALSLWNFLKEHWNNRSKLTADCKSCTTGNPGNKNIMYLQLSVENRSRLPISISRMFLDYDDQSHEFSWIPETIIRKTHFTGSDITDRQTYLSECPPHTIDALGLWGGFFYIHLSKELNKTSFMQSSKHLKLHTNRGIKYIKLTIPPEAFNPPKTFF